MKIYVVANVDKPLVRTALDELMPWLREHVEVTGLETDSCQDLSKVQTDALLVLGGDGTLLSVARRLSGRQIPLMGINFGHLGFLSTFTPINFKAHFESFMKRGLPVRSRLVLEASVLPAGVCCPLEPGKIIENRRFSATALNDAVVTAGAPFHMIRLEISADGQTGVSYHGDGAIISTASGSTAYNVSAGGPIISPDVECFCITPICPHSLSFRPMVISSASTVLVAASRVNEGTTLFCDGQASTKLETGEHVVIRRSEHDVLLVENPDARGWGTVAEKLNWAMSPKYNP